MLDCLIIDDDSIIAGTICEYFSLFDLHCRFETDYSAGIKSALEKRPSIIILDVNLGAESGFVLCKKIREVSDVPVIFISVRNTDDDVLAALGVGGDDFVTKPFSMAVLLAKVRAMLKRSASAVSAAPSPAPVTLISADTGAPVPPTSASAGAPVSRMPIGSKPSLSPHKPVAPDSPVTALSPIAPISPARYAPPAEPGIIRFGCVEIDRDSERVARNGETVRLKPMELKLLLYLYDNRGKRATKDELLQNVWGDTFLGEGTLSVHIRRLREKLEDAPEEPAYIKTVWGSGYMFERLRE